MTIETTFPTWLKHTLRVLVVPAVLVTAFTVVRADVPNKYKDGDTLSAATLNDNFAALDARLSALEKGQVPAGTIVAYAGATAPPGWLPCDGTPLDATKPMYAALYQAIGTAYGGNTTSQTFFLPDFRGRFLRGVDAAQGRDPDAATRVVSNDGGNSGDKVGSLQAHAVGQHNHPTPSVVTYGSGAYYVTQLNGSGTPVAGGSSTDNSGGAETRPVNVYVNWIIKL